MKILNEVSYLNPHTEETNILTFDDPELFKYPVAYLCEPGYWVLTDEEAAGLRAYLQKGGFVIVDDFHFAATGATSRRRCAACCPRRASSTSTRRSQIFHAFFEIKSLDVAAVLRPAAGDLPGGLREQRSGASGSWR